MNPNLVRKSAVKVTTLARSWQLDSSDAAGRERGTPLLRFRLGGSPRLLQFTDQTLKGEMGALAIR